MDGTLSKVDNEELAQSQATLVFGQMNEPPGARARVALTGLSIAEYFRDGDEQSRRKRHSFLRRQHFPIYTGWF